MESCDAERAVAAVVREQFSAEVASKEKELEHIEDRIALAKMMLKRLRLGILAQHYGMAGFAPLPLDYSEENVGVQLSWEAFEKGVIEDQRSGSEGCEENVPNEPNQPCSCNPSDCKEVASPDESQSSSCGFSNSINAAQNGSQSSTCDRTDCKKASQDVSQSSGCDLSECKKVMQDSSQSSTCESSAVEMEYLDYAVELEAGEEAPEHNSRLQLLGKNNATIHYPLQPGENCKDPSHGDISRFYSKKRIIVGNTSQYLDPTVRQSGEGSTHKWMVYVRGPSEEPDISHFVRAVRFFLHPSYHPNDIVRITNPPFHLTRLGWGEFPIRVQLEFCDRRNKPSDIIHNLVLDRTHTGLQTLGAETVVDLDIVSERVHSSLLANGPLSVNRNGVLLTQTTAMDQSSGPHNQESVTENVSFTDLQNSLLSNIEEQSMEDDISEEFSDTDMSPKPSLIIHHVSLPSSSPSDNILLDHDYCTSVVVNWTVGPLQQLEDYSSENRTLFLTTGLDKCLHAAARSIPLCGPPTGDFFLTASSLAQFKGWRVGRRRAVEWMRAVAIRRHVQKRIKISSLLTTKQVLMWCRRNGYTPLDPVVPTGSGFCKFCGCQLELEEEEEVVKEEWTRETSNLHERCQERWFGTQVGKAAGEESDEEGEEEEGEEEEEEEREGDDADTKVMYASVSDLFSTLSLPFQLFSDVVALQEQMEKEEKTRLQDQEVDIITVETSANKKKELATPRLRIPQTPELKWVRQTAAAIGIHIYPAVIDRMYAHVVEHMIFMACSRFLRAILTQAVQESGNTAEGELNQERILIPLHLYRAIQHLDLCDILTNRYLGLSPPNTH